MLNPFDVFQALLFFFSGVNSNFIRGFLAGVFFDVRFIRVFLCFNAKPHLI